MIALATVVLGVTLFTTICHAYWANSACDPQARDGWLALGTPLWFIATVYLLGREYMLAAGLCGVAMIICVCAFARWWMGDYDEPEPEVEPEQPDAELLDSHDGGAQ